MPSPNSSNFIRVASVLDTMGLHDQADEVMALLTQERAASAGLPYTTDGDEAMLQELKQFRFAVKHLYAPKDEVEEAYKESVLFRLSRAIEAREVAGNVRLAQLSDVPEPAPAIDPMVQNPFEVFARYNLGDLAKNLVRAEATRFAANNKKKVPEGEMVKAAKANLDGLIKAAMTPDNVRRMVNMALADIKENGSPEEYSRAKQELTQAADGIVAAAQGGYAAAKQQFPEVTKVWPANFTPNVLQGQAPKAEQLLSRDPRHREDLEDHFGASDEVAPSAASPEQPVAQDVTAPEPTQVPVDEQVDTAPIEEQPAADAVAPNDEFSSPEAQEWPEVPEEEVSAPVTEPVGEPQGVVETLDHEGLDDLNPITVDVGGDNNAVVEENPEVEQAVSMLGAYLETDHPQWREEIQAAPNPVEYLGGLLGGSLEESLGDNAAAVANKLLEQAQTGVSAVADDEPLSGVDHMEAPEGDEDPFGLYQHTREKFFRHPDKWPVTHSNKRGGLTVVPSHAYSLLTSHMPALHPTVLAAPTIEERQAIVERAAGLLLGAFERYFQKLNDLKREGKLGPRRMTDMAKLAPIIRQQDGEYTSWPQVVEKAKEYVSQENLPEAPPRPDDHVARSVSPMPDDLNISVSPQELGTQAPVHEEDDKWANHPPALRAYEAEHDLPPGTGGAITPPEAKPQQAHHLPQWKKKLGGFLNSLRSPKFLVPAAAVGLAGAAGIGMLGHHGAPQAPATTAPAYTTPMTTQDVNEGLSDLSSRMPPSQVGTADRVERVNPTRVAPPVHKPSPADWMRQYDKY